jgi:hypothetical protein
MPLRALAALTAAALLAALPAAADTIFWEDFDGYTSFPSQVPSGDYVNPGIPEIVEGADEFWYGGRFEVFDNGTIDQDLGVQKCGDFVGRNCQLSYPGNNTPVGRFEDEAGLLFRIDAGYTAVTLEFDWRTFSTGTGDRVVVGYHVGDDLGFDTGANRYRDFITDDFGGDNAAAEAWWAAEWTEIVRGNSGSFQHVVESLPDDEVIWVAFWLDNGEGDYGKIDNVHVQGTLIPEPGTALLLLFGIAGVGIRLLR